MIDDLKLLPMNERHLDDVLIIENSTSASPWKSQTFIKELSNPTYLLFVAQAKVDNKTRVIGFTTGLLVADELHIHSLAVDEPFRRNGVAKKLLHELFFESEQRGASKATLEVRISNVAAIKLYESLSFENRGVREKYYADNGEDAYVMWCDSIKGVL